jgi:hypothetical protein
MELLTTCSYLWDTSCANVERAQCLPFLCESQDGFLSIYVQLLMHGKLNNMRVARQRGAQASGAEEAQENRTAHGWARTYLPPH